MHFYSDYNNWAQQLAARTNIDITQRGYGKYLSFTPYIYNECSASCRFCSEKLIRDGQAMVCEGICDGYREMLEKALAYAGDREIFLSLSGKEPSESPHHLELIAEAVKNAECNGSVIKPRVMYSNLSGFVKNWDRLLKVIKALNVTRIECSRHFYEEDRNQRIVQFKSGETIKENTVFEDVVKRLGQQVPLKMVCVFQKGGVENAEDVVRYLDFARSLGVTGVVFRELSVFADGVDAGPVQQYITDSRIELLDILENLPESEFAISSINRGYYYFSFQYCYKDMEVSFEMSDYEEMIKNHTGGELHKLIFYPNGMLCRDWNMQGEIKDWR
ncbi:radical SAM protein [Butyrivibrio sp. INlla14]|uniref:radical SAM protein n=1 Tax=Butyrivibrio sp. INlla14 TaxID=1520808 RepID=UPI0008761958|nr:radical SAM protein [Butyrivibrio sp. INlla14]SCX83869.1 hypothetical protein SAMN02910371_00141 [Butyrivibrio sp. INlla14]